MGHCKLHSASTSNADKWGRRLKNWKSFWLEVRWSQWPSLALIFDSMNKQWEYLECRGKQGNLTSRCSVGFPIIFTAGYPCWSGSTVNWMVLRTQGWARNDHISRGGLWRSITHCNWGTRKLSEKLAGRDLLTASVFGNIGWDGKVLFLGLREKGEWYFRESCEKFILLLMFIMLVVAVYAPIYYDALKIKQTA